jgi:hypothetical protein
MLKHENPSMIHFAFSTKAFALKTHGELLMEKLEPGQHMGRNFETFENLLSLMSSLVNFK